MDQKFLKKYITNQNAVTKIRKCTLAAALYHNKHGIYTLVKDNLSFRLLKIFSSKK